MAKAGPYDPLEIVERSSEVKSAWVTFFFVFLFFFQRVIFLFLGFFFAREENLEKG